MLRVGIKLWLDFNQLPQQKRSFHVLKNKSYCHVSLEAFKNYLNDWAVFWVLICAVHLTVCSCDVTYAFQSESALYSCLCIFVPALVFFVAVWVFLAALLCYRLISFSLLQFLVATLFCCGRIFFVAT